MRRSAVVSPSQRSPHEFEQKLSDDQQSTNHLVPIKSSRSIIFFKNANESVEHSLSPSVVLFYHSLSLAHFSHTRNRFPFFSSLSGKNFSIFATLPSGCSAYRYSISSGIERPTYVVTETGDKSTSYGVNLGGKKNRTNAHRAIRLKDVTRPSFTFIVVLTFVIVIISSIGNGSALGVTVCLYCIYGYVYVYM